MNVLFHTATAIGITVLLTDTRSMEQPGSSKKIIGTGILAFILGIIGHAALDYIPHCYPIPSKVDAIASLAIILFTTWCCNKKYRLIIVLSFLGSIFPDLIDLSPAILNKQLGLAIPKFEKVFPWHFHEYSGSIYDDSCRNSTLNHELLLLSIVIICWCRRTDAKMIFS